MNENVIIRFAEIREYPAVKLHYKACNYIGGLEDENKVVIALADDQVIGAVRLCIEHDTHVLRGMYLKKHWQKKGIGSAMLNFLNENADLNECYCLPYKWLKEFYASFGFKEIPATKAPAFLAGRLKKYLSIGSVEIIIMKLRKS